VTHDQSEALTMSDRVAVFNDGRIQHRTLRQPDDHVAALRAETENRAATDATATCHH